MWYKNIRGIFESKDYKFHFKQVEEKGMFFALRYMNLKLKSNLDRKDRLESDSI